MKKLVRWFTAIALLTASLSLLATAPGLAAAGVNFSLEPATVTVNPGDVFTVTIRVDASTQAINVVQIGIDFDPTIIKVTNSAGIPIPDSGANTKWDNAASQAIMLTPEADAAFPDKLTLKVNNTAGQVTLALGTGFSGSPVQENLLLARVTFKAVGVATSRALTFNTTDPLRATLAAYGDNVTGTRTGSTVTIRQQAVTPNPTTPTTPPPTTTPTTQTPAVDLNITGPVSGTVTTASHRVSGTVSNTGITSATLTLNGIAETIKVTDGRYSETVTLAPGENTISITAASGAGTAVTYEYTMTYAPAGTPAPSTSPPAVVSPTTPPKAGETTPAATGGNSPSSPSATETAGTAAPTTTSEPESSGLPDWAVTAGIAVAVVVVGGVTALLLLRKR